MAIAVAPTAEYTYALGSKEGRDRINQQLRANPDYIAFLRSIGADPNGGLSDQQRKQAKAWVTQNVGPVGGLEIDPAGNLNNPQGFSTQLKQWGPVAAAAGGIAAAPWLLPMLAGSAATAPTVTPVLAGGTGATTAGGTAAGAALLPNTGGALTAGLSGVAPTVASQGPSLLPAVSAASQGSRLSRLLRDPDLYRAGGKALQGYSEAQARNRGTQMDAAYQEQLLYQQALRDYADAMVAREQEGRAGRKDAWEQLQAAQHVQNATGGALGFSPYSRAIAAPTAGERSGAQALEAEVRRRLEGGNPIPEIAPPERTSLSRYGKPGKAEQIAGYGGAGLDIWGALGRWL